MKKLIHYIKESAKFNALFGTNKKYVNKAVDLGLSVKWATCNVGAETLEDPGLLFQFGRTDGYEYGNKNNNFDLSRNIPETTSGKKYGRSKQLDLTDDAAHVNMGGKWRMPTRNEIKELLDNTTNEWTKENGVYGRKFISKTDDSKWIFIPASGFFRNTFYDITENSSIWASSVDSKDSFNAWSLYFNSYDCFDCPSSRYNGYSVRGVCE